MPTTITHEEAVAKVREVHEIQGRDGNWNYSPYMRGMFNGLELALSILEGERDPQYRDEPDSGYGCDRPVPDMSGPEFAPVAAEG